MNRLRAEFFTAGKQAAEQGDTAANCWLCGLTINYDVPPNTEHDSHNLDHYYPVAHHPELQEDPANFRHSHARCNARRGKDAPTAGLGTLSRAWI